MSDNSSDSITDRIDQAVGSGKITETITVPFSADMTPSQMAKVMRSVANVMHAMVSNLTRYAAIGEGRNVGAGHPSIQQMYSCAANADAAAMGLEQGNRTVLDPSRLPPPPGIGRA
jgi:hypothetical protein